MPADRETGRQGERTTTRTAADRLFRWGVVGKGVYGGAELVLGILLTLVSTSTLQSWAAALTQRELTRDPDDALARLLVSRIDSLTTFAVVFVAVYLIAHGVVKLGLLAAVLSGAYRTYPWAIAVLVAFIGYQIFDLFVGFTVGLLLLTVFDAVIVVLTWRDYRSHSRPVAAAAGAAAHEADDLSGADRTH
ncbi:DUF2127 domain-containing protein [Frondihabitans peucedani]|uniref:DUF2127 domain-containing protein n=1 Tax=Frondihabitans peucedani TaxID=598626 RepID=A0ABP8E561_9MICO